MLIATLEETPGTILKQDLIIVDLAYQRGDLKFAASIIDHIYTMFDKNNPFP